MKMNGAVPVSMGSPRYESRDIHGCRVTLVWFPGGAMLPCHFHAHPTLSVTLDGAVDVHFANPDLRVPSLRCVPGTVLTQPAGEPHANHIMARGARAVILQPDLERGDLPSRCAKLLGQVNHFRDGPIAMTARRLAREMAAPDALTPVTVKGLALEMLAEAARLHSDRCLRPVRTEQWLAAVVDHIHAHFRGNPRIQDIADAVGVEPGRLTARFRTVHRVPLGTYIRRLRLEWSADRLAATSVPIARIAFEAGYADQAHLTRAFKSAFGTTPAAYRRSRAPFAAHSHGLKVLEALIARPGTPPPPRPPRAARRGP